MQRQLAHSCKCRFRMTETVLFVVSVLLSVLLGVVLLLAFSHLRRLPQLSFAFSPKFPSRARSLLDWVLPMLDTRPCSSTQVDQLGLDVVMYLRFFRLGIRFFAWSAFFGVLVLMPLHLTGSYQDSSVLVKLTMAHVDSGSHLFGVHLVFVYLETLLLALLLYFEYLSFVELRHRHFLVGFTESKSPRRRSVLVTDIPDNLRFDES